MLLFTCYFHFSATEGIQLRTPDNANHVLSVELLDDDSPAERVIKLEAFTRKCDRLKKALCNVYPFVSVTKVRTQVTNYYNIKK